jgi:hypothetical protein
MGQAIVVRHVLLLPVRIRLVVNCHSVILAHIQAGERLGVSQVGWFDDNKVDKYKGPKYAASESCPLNVCCSQYGFCKYFRLCNKLIH